MTTLAVYIAARMERRGEMQSIAERLRAKGVRVTSRWLTGELDRLPDGKKAEADLIDIDASHGVLNFTDDGSVLGWTGGGAHWEAGYARGRGLHVWLVGPKTHVFHSLPYVVVYPNLRAWEAKMLVAPPYRTDDGQPIQPPPGAQR